MTDLQQLPPSARGGGKVSGVALLLDRAARRRGRKAVAVGGGEVAVRSVRDTGSGGLRFGKADQSGQS